MSALIPRTSCPPDSLSVGVGTLWQCALGGGLLPEVCEEYRHRHPDCGHAALLYRSIGLLDAVAVAVLELRPAFGAERQLQLWALNSVTESDSPVVNITGLVSLENLSLQRCRCPVGRWWTAKSVRRGHFGRSTCEGATWASAHFLKWVKREPTTILSNPLF